MCEKRIQISVLSFVAIPEIVLEDTSRDGWGVAWSNYNDFHLLWTTYGKLQEKMNTDLVFLITWLLFHQALGHLFTHVSGHEK